MNGRMWVSLIVLVMGLMGCSKSHLLQPGAVVPAVSIQNQDGEQRSLRDYQGTGLLVYFYPKDDTPGCTKEACTLRDSWDAYERAGIRVVGVSADSPETHQRFIAKYDLPFELLSDTHGELAEAFGVPRTLGMFSRVSFLVDRESVVRATYPKVDPGVHASEVLEDAERKGLTEGVTDDRGRVR